MKIKPPGQGIEPPPEFPDSPVPGPPSGTESVPPPVTPERPPSSPALARLSPPSTAFAAAALRAVANKLDAAADPVLLLERLRHLASAPPSLHAHALRRILAGLEKMAQGSPPQVPEPDWLRLEPWDPEEPLPTLELLARAGGALGIARDPLAEQLAERLVAGGMEDLEAAHLGRQAAGIMLTVQWAWDRNSKPPAAGNDSLLQALEEQRQDVQQMINAARKILERHVMDLPPPEPPSLRV